MSAFECPREQEVLDEIDGGGWPDRASDELRAHAAACDICRDLVAVASLLREDAAPALQAALVPSPGQVWWRAELRARNEAARSVQRPMTIVQALAAACTIAAFLALVSLAAPSIAGWIARFAGDASASKADLVAISGFVAQWSSLLALAAGAWLVLAPVAVYLLLRDDSAVTDNGKR